MVIRLSFLSVMLASSGAIAQAPGRPSEYAVKAAYIYNFAKFVEWQPGTFDHEGKFIIGMLGDDAFGNVLEHALADKQVSGYPIVLERYSTLEEARGAHILFIPASREHDLEFVPTLLGGDPVLTVSDAPGFAERGVMINFFITNDNKVRFEVNLEAAESCGLRLSSQLLKLATLVRSRS